MYHIKDKEAALSLIRSAVDIESKILQSCTIFRSKTGPGNHMGLENLLVLMASATTRDNCSLDT